MGNLDFLRETHPYRLRRLLSETIRHLELDLKGARVLTEAGSNVFAITPIIAAAAGAEVLALTRDSIHASAAEVSRQVTAVAEKTGVGMEKTRVLTDRASISGELDLITNLGFVRPIDAELLGILGSTGAVTYMCEAWETREGDVDLAACTERNVPVAGLWENYNGLDIFQSCGQLAMKMCLEAGIEIAGNRLVLVSPDRFGPVIADALKANHADVETVSSVDKLSEPMIANADAIIVADYTREEVLLGGNSGPSAAELVKWNPALLIIQFAGTNDVLSLTNAGIKVFPTRQLLSRRMAFTLAHLGVRPTLLLHAAGLKVGELLWRARRGEAIPDQFVPLIQPMNGPAEQLLTHKSCKPG